MDKCRGVIMWSTISCHRLPVIGDRVVLQENHYLILIPIYINKNISWMSLLDAPSSCTNLLTINKLITDLQNEQLQAEELKLYKETIDFYEHAPTSSQSRKH